MNRISLVPALLGAAFVAANTGTAVAAVYNNNNGTTLWSDAGNWAGGTIGDNGETVQLNPAGTINVDSDFDISRLQNSSGSGSQTIQTVAAGSGSLTINTNSASTATAIRNVSLGSPSTMTINTDIVINNTNANPGFSEIRNNNNGGNALVFGAASTLDLTTDVVVVQAAGGTIEFNGSIEGAGNLRYTHNNVTFGATSNNSTFTGEMVILNGANITVNTASGNTFYSGPKFQFNGNGATMALTLNNADVVDQVNIRAGGAPTINLTVNANQTFGDVGLGGSTINLTLGAGVTDLDFGDSSGLSWAGGTLNIVNFTDGVVGFSNINGLTSQQLSQITIDGGAAALGLDVNGKLVIPEPGSLALMGLGATFMIRRKR
ncbi:MAG: PEP-CTERM sorting domain-containing protein [Planctomycetota bacterium]